MEQQPGYVQPQYVMVQAPPHASTNWLGVFGFLVALVGIFIPTGVVSLIGVALCLGALGRAPRGLAVFGLILGILGAVGWLAVMLIALLGGLIGIAAAGSAFVGGFILTQPETVEVTTDMVNIAMALEEYADEHDGPPAELAVLPLGNARLTDPWGTGYRVIWTQDDDDRDIISAGPDRDFDTDDDIRMSRLDDYWEDSWERYEDQMERMDRNGKGEWQRWSGDDWDCDWSSDCESKHTHDGKTSDPRSYEEEARDMIKSRSDDSSRVWVGDGNHDDASAGDDLEVEIIIETHSSTTRPKSPEASRVPEAPEAPEPPDESPETMDDAPAAPAAPVPTSNQPV